MTIRSWSNLPIADQIDWTSLNKEALELEPRVTQYYNAQKEVTNTGGQDGIGTKISKRVLEKRRLKSEELKAFYDLVRQQTKNSGNSKRSLGKRAGASAVWTKVATDILEQQGVDTKTGKMEDGSEIGSEAGVEC